MPKNTYITVEEKEILDALKKQYKIEDYFHLKAKK